MSLNGDITVRSRQKNDWGDYLHKRGADCRLGAAKKTR